MASASPFIVRSLSPESYATLLEGQRHPLYLTPWWLAVVLTEREALRLGCYRGERCVALYTARYTAKQIITPSYCQYTGVYYLDEGLTLYEQQCITQALHAALPSHHYYHVGFAPDYTDWLGLYWLGYRQTTRYNYVWSLAELTSEEAIRQSISSSLRKNLKATVQAGFTFLPSVSTQEALEVLAQTAAYKGYKGDIPLMRRLMDEALVRGAGRLVGIQTATGQLAMVAFWVEHQGVAYLIGEGTNRERSGRYQLKVFMLMNYILLVRSLIDTIDFEGSMLEPIAKIYQALGATQSSYMSITRGRRYSLPFLWHSAALRLGLTK